MACSSSVADGEALGELVGEVTQVRGGEVVATVIGVRPGLDCWMEGAEEEGGAVGEEQKAASALYRAREG